MLCACLAQAVLAGDPHQLGPVLRSTPALAHGLGMSLLERLMARDLFQRDEKKFADHGSYDPLLVSSCIDAFMRTIWLLESLLLRVSYCGMFHLGKHYSLKLFFFCTESFTESCFSWSEMAWSREYDVILSVGDEAGLQLSCAPSTAQRLF